MAFIPCNKTNTKNGLVCKMREGHDGLHAVANNAGNFEWPDTDDLELDKYFEHHEKIWRFFTDNHVGGDIVDMRNRPWNDSGEDIGEWYYWDEDGEECSLEIYGTSVWRKGDLILVTEHGMSSYLFSAGMKQHV